MQNILNFTTIYPVNFRGSESSRRAIAALIAENIDFTEIISDSETPEGDIVFGKKFDKSLFNEVHFGGQAIVFIYGVACLETNYLELTHDAPDKWCLSWLCEHVKFFDDSAILMIQHLLFKLCRQLSNKCILVRTHIHFWEIIINEVSNIAQSFLFEFVFFCKVV